MNLKPTKKLRIIALGIILLGVSMAGIAYFYHIFGFEPDLVPHEIPTSYQIQTTILPHQTPYNCGPYNVYMIASRDNRFSTSAEELVARINTWKIPKLGFLPFHIRKLLTSVNHTGKTLNVRHLDDQDRLEIISAEIATGNPVIVLVKKHGYQHYITVLGYDKDKYVWHIYDPMLEQSTDQNTVDLNGEDTGNETLSGDELLYLWSGGGMFSFYEWHAISVTKNK